MGLTIEIPFVLFAVLLPFVGPPPDGVGGLSIAGLWAAWNILIKASLGVLTATLLSATTLPVDLVAGLRSLRMPTSVVAILTFFVRYVDVVADQYTRMRVAQQVRGMRSTSPRSWPVIASGLAALFVRSYERGERVHLALVSRGYDGKLPAPRRSRAFLGDRRGTSCLRRRHFRDRSDGAMVIELRGVDYTYPDGTAALRDVSLSIARDERVTLLGPNGAGKTTLALHLNGVLETQEGEVRVAGRRVERSTLRDTRRQVGMVFQDPDDQLFMPTVAQDVAFGPTNFELPDVPGRVQRALDAVGMGAVAQRAPHHLSFGQRRRGDRHGLSMDPEILVLDEPSSNLDPASRRELAEVLESLDVTMLMVTHDLLFAWRLCPRSVVLSEGRIRYDGSTHELLTDAELLARFRLGCRTG